MELFLSIANKISETVPDWVGLIVPAALVIALGVLFTVAGGRKAYVPLAVALGAVGFFLVCAAKDATAGCLYAAAFVLLASLCRLLFLIPCPRRNRNADREKKRRDRDEEIYRKFHEDIVIPEDEGEPGDAPLATAEECGACLSHVTALLAKLKREKLSPADRLEIEALTRTVEGYRGKALSEKELHLVNDCLATVLKYTAKYKL